MIASNKKEIYFREMSAAFLLASKSNENQDVSRAVLWGVRWFGRIGKTVDTFGKYTMAEAILFLIGTLTPREFVEIFPIEKNYDGDRTGTKDYFYTIKSIESHGWDKLITENEDGAFGFLWDYTNWDISHFAVEYMSCMSDMRRIQGKPGIMEQWADDNNIPTYTMHTSADGKQYISDKDGRTKPVKKHRPKHLKIVR